MLTLDGDFEEWGQLPQPGARSDLQGLYEETRKGKSNSELWAEFPGAMMKYHKAVDRLRLDLAQGSQLAKMEEEFKEAALRPWQSTALEMLNGYGSSSRGMSPGSVKSKE